MVYMAHNADYRRTGNHLAFVFFFLFEQLCYHINLFFRFCNAVKFQCDFFCMFIIDILVYRNHRTL